MALFGFPPWGTHLHQQPLCLFAMGSGSVPELMLLEANPPPASPPQTCPAPPACSTALNFWTSSSKFTLGTLTCSSGCLSCFTTQSRIWAVTPTKEQTPTRFSRTAS